jgi:hypothetical protein
MRLHKANHAFWPQMLKVSVGDKVAVNVFRLPRDAFAVTVLSAQLSFVTKKNIKEAAPVELDAAILNAHIQSRFGGQVCLLLDVQQLGRVFQQVTHLVFGWEARMTLCIHQGHHHMQSVQKC